MNRIYKKGKLVEIQKSGKTIWKNEDYIQRNKISQQSIDKLIDAYSNSNTDKFMADVFEILTGQKVEEAQK